MLTKKIDDSRKQVEFNSLEDLVPRDHLLRKVDKAINFDFIYDEVKHLYSDIGRPSVDPVVLIKIVLIQYLFGIPSMRQTIAEIQVNIAYRWFMGYSISESIPHFSTFSKNYSRRFKDSDVFSTIFAKILEIAAAEGLLAPEQIYIDSTHIKASANKKKYVKVEVEVEAKKYKEQLDKEIEEDREQHGKKPPKGGSSNSRSVETKVIPQSTTDSDSGMFYKSEKEKCFAYLAHTACDDYLEEAEHLRYNSYVASVYKRRKETIERVFADAKEKHGMRYTHLRGLAQIKMAVTLTFACMNLKKLATKLWKKRRKSSFIHTRFWDLKRISFCF